MRYTMWIIVSTLKGKNSFLDESGEWTEDRFQAECFDKFDYAVHHRDSVVSLRERRGVGIVKVDNAPRQSSQTTARI